MGRWTASPCNGVDVFGIFDGIESIPLRDLKGFEALSDDECRNNRICLLREGGFRIRNGQHRLHEGSPAAFSSKTLQDN